jgi:hypothetical protein
MFDKGETIVVPVFGTFIEPNKNEDHRFFVQCRWCLGHPLKFELEKYPRVDAILFASMESDKKGIFHRNRPTNEYSMVRRLSTYRRHTRIGWSILLFHQCHSVSFQSEEKGELLATLDGFLVVAFDDDFISDSLPPFFHSPKSTSRYWQPCCTN